MSRLRKMEKPDSLELLLDTMCNTFGGIIMIALLIALLSRDSSSDASAVRQAEQRIEDVAKQIAEAETLQKKLLAETDTNTSPVMVLLEERDRLRNQIQESQAVIASNTMFQANMEATNNPAEAEKISALIKAQLEQTKALAAQIDRETQSHQRALRLPRERLTGKKSYYIVVRYSRFYPVFLIQGGERERNSQMFDWQSNEDGDIATPRPNVGMDLNGLARIFNEVPAQSFSVHFIVYSDSFPSFLAGRQIPLARGYDTGWEFLTTDRPVIFSSRGEAPPAL